MIDDIPEATREGFSIPQQPIKKGFAPLSVLISLLILSTLAFGATRLLSFQPSSRTDKSKPNEQTSQKNTTTQTESSSVEAEKGAIDSDSSSVSESKPSESKPKDDLLGHLPYQEAKAADLVAVTSDGRIKLHQSAATRFREMQAAAKADGVDLVILSGFRDVESQNYLFFKVKEQRVQATAKRAEVSAPPGHSEHHTGYALDFGDAGFPATHLETSFEETPVFKWLAKNAPKYSFELSFPRDNPQGISYEPWHWRFVGDRPSLETFYKARNF